MEILLYQFTYFIVFTLLFAFAYRSKNKKYIGAVILLALISLFGLQPIKFNNQGGANLEYNINRFDDIPEKITGESIDFQEQRKYNLERMSQMSEDKLESILKEKDDEND